MSRRRIARERAMQFLVQHDLNPAEDLDRALDEFWQTDLTELAESGQRKTKKAEPGAANGLCGSDVELRLFADALIRGTIEHMSEIDALIKKHAKNWDLPRMATVDRNLLRLAIYEMLHREDIPPVVSINEAIEIAKKYSTEDSGRFVNGILDKIRAELMRPARTPLK
ncbi:MAG: transcription antitermination factor NusB [Verrucomicrobiae bacterium]|nr:transcription antitermination factor NusB [Verrucomicrobiae bacterium]MCX7723017.1 transcription antitermination factor NusB [Verrucomicrobiae bacterium]